MELQYYGANCVRLTSKKASLVVDDNMVSFGKKSVTKDSDVELVSNTKIITSPQTGRLFITFPGEYEVSDVSVKGVAVRAHMDEEGKKKDAVLYKIVADDIRVAFAGHIFSDITDAELEQLGAVDVLVIPVGGNGYTTDGVDALKLIKKIEPKIVVPTHYEQKGFNYEVPQQPLDEALKGLGLEITETVPKLKLKASDIPQDLKLIVIEPTL